MRKLKGIIVSNKMQKTVTVRIDRLRLHPKYRKYYRVSKKVNAHSENSDWQEGDEVMIEETRPLSKQKQWRVIGLVRRKAIEEDIQENKEVGK